MTIAAYKVENLFDRAKAFDSNSPEAPKVVEQEATLNNLFSKTNSFKFFDGFVGNSSSTDVDLHYFL